MADHGTGSSQPSGSADEPDGSPAKRWWKGWRDPTTLATAIGGLATIVATCFAGFQLWGEGPKLKVDNVETHSLGDARSDKAEDQWVDKKGRKLTSGVVLDVSVRNDGRGEDTVYRPRLLVREIKELEECGNVGGLSSVEAEYTFKIGKSTRPGTLLGPLPGAAPVIVKSDEPERFALLIDVSGRNRPFVGVVDIILDLGDKKKLQYGPIAILGNKPVKALLTLENDAWRVIDGGRPNIDGPACVERNKRTLLGLTRSYGTRLDENPQFAFLRDELEKYTPTPRPQTGPPNTTQPQVG